MVPNLLEHGEGDDVRDKISKVEISELVLAVWERTRFEEIERVCFISE